MKKSYLIEVLEKLSPKQMKELSELVQSPFFNKNESIIRLFEYLRIQYPEFKSENIEKEIVHKKIFNLDKYNDNFMRMLIFKLTYLAEEYLAYTHFKSDPYEESMHLINTLLDMDLDNDARKQINQLGKKINITDTNREYYKNKYELERFKTVIYSRTYRPVTVKDKPDESLLEESNNLTAFFLISILQRYRYLLNKSYSVNIKYKPEFLPYITEFLEGEGKAYLNILMISLLYKQIMLLKDYSREDLIEELIDELTNDKLKIDDEERRDGLTVMGNVCIEKAYEGKQVYYEKLLNIYKYLISKNLYNRVRGRYFESEMFHNIVTLGLKLDETEWIRGFIEKFYKKLAPDTQANTYNFSYAKLYFKTRDFEKALESIAKVAYTDLHMKINVRITAITILFELQKIEEVLTQIENFRKYIQNDKLLSTVHKKISSNFIKFTSALCKAKYSTGTDLRELKKNIAEADQVSNRVWLLNKTDELMELRKDWK
ncbi:MAG TPA: hypothetical protein VGK25_08305 [Ignavibacteria bacterium]